MLGAPDHGNPAVAHRLVSAGRAIHGVQIEIHDPATGDRLPIGERGEVWVRSEQVMGGAATGASRLQAVLARARAAGDLTSSSSSHPNGRFALCAAAHVEL